MLPFLFIPHQCRCRCGSRRLLLFLFSVFILFFFCCTPGTQKRRVLFSVVLVPFLYWVFIYGLYYILASNRKYTRHEKLYAEDGTKSSGKIARRHLTSVVGGMKLRKIGVSFASTLCVQCIVSFTYIVSCWNDFYLAGKWQWIKWKNIFIYFFFSLWINFNWICGIFYAFSQ